MAVYELLGCGRCRACAGGAGQRVPGRRPRARSALRATAAWRTTSSSRHATSWRSATRSRPCRAADRRRDDRAARRRARTAAARAGATAVVVGVGGLGHLAVQFLRATSDVRVLAVDVDRARLDFAAGIGADDGVLTGRTPRKASSRRTPAARSTSCFDFVGAQESLDLAAAVTGRGGAIVVTGGGGGQAVDHRAEGPAERPTARSRWCTRSAAAATISCGPSRSPRPAGSARTSRSHELAAAGRVLAELDAGKRARARRAGAVNAPRIGCARMTSPLGEFIRRQRELQELSMRQLADLVGISNPYLSQIERGLREPSEKVLEAIAQNLQLSADALSRARRPASGDADEGDEPAVVAAIRADPRLTARERQALLEIYNAFVERRRRRRGGAAADGRGAGAPRPSCAEGGDLGDELAGGARVRLRELAREVGLGRGGGRDPVDLGRCRRPSRRTP